MNWEVKYYPEYWYGKKPAYPHVPKESGKFSRRMVIGNLLFVSGRAGKDTVTDLPIAEKFEDQMIVALDKIKTAMEEAGSSMENIVEAVMPLKRLEDYPKKRKAEAEYYQQHAPHLVANPPVSSFMQLPGMVNPEALFEIDVTAVLWAGEIGRKSA